MGKIHNIYYPIPRAVTSEDNEELANKPEFEH